MVERLPYTPPLLADELLSSWIARIEAYYLMHGALRRWLVRELLEDPERHIFGHVAGLFDIAPTDAMLARLARLTGTDPGFLRSRTLPAAYPGLRAEDFAQAPCSVGSIPASRASFCRECTHEMLSMPAGQYLRQEWALLWQTVCPRHLSLLEDLVSGCGRCDEFSPTWSAGCGARFLCQACHCARFGLAFDRSLHSQNGITPWGLVSRFEQQTLAALATGTGDGPWRGTRSQLQVRRVLQWFVDFTGQLERHPKDGASPMLRRMCPRLFPQVACRAEPITSASLPSETILVRQQLVLALLVMLSSPAVKDLLDPYRGTLIANGFMKPQTGSEWLLEIAEAAIAGVRCCELAQFAPCPRRLIAEALNRYERDPEPFQHRYSMRALPGSPKIEPGTALLHHSREHDPSSQTGTCFA